MGQLNMQTRQGGTTAIPFENTYARLPERFFARLPPTPVKAPKLVKLNEELANTLGLDAEMLRSEAGLRMLSGNALPPGADPIAMAYAGHQFGNWVPQLGDGRAVLLGEVVGTDGVRRDIQLKGAGPTPFSRMGDGRAALGPVLREYIVSEAMAALGIPTTRSLAAVATGEAVMREQPLPGGILTRVAQSHIRIGTFQFFAARGDNEAVRLLADHVIERHYPHLRREGQPYRALIEAVARAQARLVAKWQAIGFIHGVMNTDNMSIAGETIDFGPCAFMDTYHPGQVFSSIDRMGRYAYANQPRIAYWNLACLAQALFPLLAEDEEAMVEEARLALEAFPAEFDRAWIEAMRRKLGLFEARDGDEDLARDLLRIMSEGEADFTLTFRYLSDAAGEDADAMSSAKAQFSQTAAGAFDGWTTKWHARLAVENRTPDAHRSLMKSANPVYIPRNHRVEEAIAAAYQDNFSPFDSLVEVLQKPYEAQDAFAEYERPPRLEEVVTQTFCGT
jgi:serine/tyrosine/threonine adenylyltransferase